MEILMLLLGTALLFCPQALASDGTSSEWETRDYRFSVGIYNDVAGSYALRSRSASGEGPFTPARALAVLAQAGEIEDFMESRGRLLSVTYLVEGTPVTLHESETRRFYLKRNGVAVSEENLEQYVSDGDILEWVYTTAEQYEQIQASLVQEPEPEEELPVSDWAAEAASLQADACSWLDRYATSSTWYLLAVGCAGRTADAQVVSRLQAEARLNTSEEEPSPDQMRQILLLSFCGFDTSNADLSQLLSSLMTRGDLALLDNGYSEALLAYDCRGYAIPNSAPNSRNTLIDSLLSLQRDNGGFSVQESEERASPGATFWASIALAPYAGTERVRTSLNQAVDYLAAACQAASCPSVQLSQAITVLSSLGLSLDDERFWQGELGLVERLMASRLTDGSFALQPESTAGDALATEMAVVALASIRRNGNPFRVPSALRNTVPVSAQSTATTPAGAQKIYWIAGALLVSVLLLILLAILLKRTGKRKK